MDASSTPSGSLSTSKSDRKELLIGSALAIAGNLLISISLNLQKYTHKQNEGSGSQVHYLRKPIWWLGLLLMTLGEIGNFSAYGFAPASLVAPLGSTTVIANMFIAVLCLKEKLRPEDIFGCTFAVLGAFLLVIFSDKGDFILTAKAITVLLQETGFIIYACVEMAVLIGLFVLRYQFKIINIIVLLLIASILASFTVISAKATSSMLQLTIAGDMQLQYPVFYIMLVIMVATAVIQIKYLNQAMKEYDSTTVVPTFFVLFTISAILAGVILYKEFMGLGPLKIFMFIFGCLLCFIGVYFITAGRAKARDSRTESLPSMPKLIANVFPSWLYSDVTQSEVQPRQQNYITIRHSSSSDSEPIIDRVASSSDEYDNGDNVVTYGSVHSNQSK